MKTLWMLPILCAAGTLCGGETVPQVPASVNRLAVFKNGVSAVERLLTPPPGDFLMTEEIAPIEGTLWFAPSGGLSIERVMRPVDEPNRFPFQNPALTFAGKKITVCYGENKTLTGIVAAPSGEAPNSEYLTLRKEDGKTVSLKIHLIESIESDDVPATIPAKRPVLLFHPRNRAAGPLSMRYLTRGVNWVPAYRITLGPNMELQLEYSATLTNQLEDLVNVETVLIAGHPNFATEAISALSTMFTPAQPLPYPKAYANGMFQQRGMPMPVAEFAMTDSAGSAAPESGTTEDLHPEKIGKITLKKGDSLYLPLNSATTKFERLVEWTIADRFNYDGTYFRGNNFRADGELYDALRFKNPFSSPMTTAPIEICDGDSVLAQSEGKWVNPDEETILPITKALTVSGTVVEYEINDPEKLVKERGSSVSKSGPGYIWREGMRYRNPEVAGTLTVKNFRKQDALILIKLRYSGELVSAQGEPKSEVVERTVYSVNKRNELTWSLTLKPGEERKLDYKYSLLIRD